MQLARYRQRQPCAGQECKWVSRIAAPCNPKLDITWRSVIARTPQAFSTKKRPCFVGPKTGLNVLQMRRMHCICRDSKYAYLARWDLLFDRPQCRWIGLTWQTFLVNVPRNSRKLTDYLVSRKRGVKHLGIPNLVEKFCFLTRCIDTARMR